LVGGDIHAKLARSQRRRDEAQFSAAYMSAFHLGLTNGSGCPNGGQVLRAQARVFAFGSDVDDAKGFARER